MPGCLGNWKGSHVPKVCPRKPDSLYQIHLKSCHHYRNLSPRLQPGGAQDKPSLNSPGPPAPTSSQYVGSNQHGKSAYWTNGIDPCGYGSSFYKRRVKLKSFFPEEIQEPRYALGLYPDLSSQITLNKISICIYNAEAFVSISFCHEKEVWENLKIRTEEQIIPQVSSYWNLPPSQLPSPSQSCLPCWKYTPCGWWGSSEKPLPLHRVWELSSGLGKDMGR